MAGLGLNHEDLGHSKDSLTAVAFMYKSTNMFTKGLLKSFRV